MISPCGAGIKQMKVARVARRWQCASGTVVGRWCLGILLCISGRAYGPFVMRLLAGAAVRVSTQLVPVSLWINHVPGMPIGQDHWRLRVVSFTAFRQRSATLS